MHHSLILMLGELRTLSMLNRSDIVEIRKRVERLERRKERLGFIEMVSKAGLTIGAPLFTLWATGSVEKAAEVFKLLVQR